MIPRFYRLRTAKWTLALALLAGSPALIGTAGWAAASNAPNVIMVVMDCVRADHLSAYGYTRETAPFLSELANRGKRYANAYATSSWTKPSVASLLTGLGAGRHGAAARMHPIAEDVPGLSEMLLDSGYESHFVVGGNAWIERAFGFARAAKTLVNDKAFQGDRMQAQLQERLEQAQPPFFLYAHFMEAHKPYHPGTHNLEFGSPLGLGALMQPGMMGTWAVLRRAAAGLLTARDRQALMNTYDAAIFRIDRTLAAVDARLQALGYANDTIVIVTADHGDEFGEHGGYDHGHSTYQELLRVPLIVAGPGIDPGVVTAPVSLIDVAPTLMSSIEGGVERTRFDGTDVLAAGIEGLQRRFFAVSSLYGAYRYAAISGRKKVVTTSESLQAGMPLVGATPVSGPAVFDLARDPGETAPKALRTDADFQLLDWLREHSARVEQRAHTGRNVEADVDSLRALGYLQ